MNNKMDKQELEEKLEVLESNPIFKMSLGSKELFHSNFLEFLWDIDHAKFVEMINDILKSKKMTYSNNSSFSYTFDREKENFDVCIHHKKENTKNKSGWTKDYYDLIIENKVKSIPRKDQLDSYYDKAKLKAQGKKDPIFLLLSLVEEFPCKKELENSKWIVANYKDISNAINNSYSNSDYSNYINDYCIFIDIMSLLQGEMVNDFENQEYYNKEQLERYKKLRIHDLYIKLRGSLFITKLKEKLSQDKDGIVSPENIHILPFIYDITNKPFKYEDIRSYCKKHEGIHLFLDCAIQQGAGMVAVYIYKHREKCDFIYEIAIQDNQYRHGINSYEKSDLNDEKTNRMSEKDKGNAKDLKELWNAVYKNNSDFFDTIHDSNEVLPGKGTDGGYNKYAPNYVYRYVKLYSGEDEKKKERVSSLIESFVTDIKMVVEKKLCAGQ